MTVVLQRGGALGLALMYLVSAMGIPLPVEIPLFLSGKMVHHGIADLIPVALLAWFFTSLGSVLAFMLARLGGRPLLHRLSRGLDIEEHVLRLEDRIRRYGLWAIVVTRWANWAVGLTLWATGFSDLPARRVLAVMLVNTAIWALAWVQLGRLAVRWLHVVGLHEKFFLIPLAVILVAVAVWRRARHSRTL